MRCLSVRQPWAWLLIFGGKNIENRDWYTGHRGPLAIHAAKGMTKVEYYSAIDFVSRFDRATAMRVPYWDSPRLVRGAIIGTVDQVDCVGVSDSPWFQGKFGHVYTNPRPLEVPAPANGQLGFWDWDGRPEVLR